jgi:hypothetical protein
VTITQTTFRDVNELLLLLLVLFLFLLNHGRLSLLGLFPPLKKNFSPPLSLGLLRSLLPVGLYTRAGYGSLAFLLFYTCFTP